LRHAAARPTLAMAIAILGSPPLAKALDTALSLAKAFVWSEAARLRGDAFSLVIMAVLGRTPRLSRAFGSNQTSADAFFAWEGKPLSSFKTSASGCPALV